MCQSCAQRFVRKPRRADLLLVLNYFEFLERLLEVVFIPDILRFRLEVHEVVADVEQQSCALERIPFLVVALCADSVEYCLILAGWAAWDLALV